MNPNLFFPRSRHIAIFPFTLICLSANLHAQPRLHCDITYAGTTQQFDAYINNDPSSAANTDTYAAYTTEATDIAGRFRFKAILLGTRQHLETIKLYAYYETDRHPVLLSEAIYNAPFIYSTIPNSMTGLNHLYSPPLERELLYGCALEEQS